MKIKLEKSDWLEDWYTIEKAEHNHAAWLQPIAGNGLTFMHSGRISDACVEGTAQEMLAIAQAIKDRGAVDFRRCAVRVKNGTAYFCSPRNSLEDAEIPLADADEFAEQVFSMLSNNVKEQG